jgi:hypothetical protein
MGNDRGDAYRPFGDFHGAAAVLARAVEEIENRPLR